MNNKNALLPLLPFAPIVYFNILKSNNVTFEFFENYPKQTYRNRYFILSANGKMPLTIPVIGQEGKKTPIQEILIDNKLNWQELHFRSLESAYRSSAFYDHYTDLFSPLFKNKYDRLVDFNKDSLFLILKILGLKTEIKKTNTYSIKTDCDFDYRDQFKPSKENWNHFQFNKYFQVFSYKFGFQKNLSILDLIFNEGPAAKNCI